MGPQRSRWRCPKRDGLGKIEELSVEIGLRFVNRMSHLVTPDRNGKFIRQTLKEATSVIVIQFPHPAQKLHQV